MVCKCQSISKQFFFCRLGQATFFEPALKISSLYFRAMGFWTICLQCSVFLSFCPIPFTKSYAFRNMYVHRFMKFRYSEKATKKFEKNLPSLVILKKLGDFFSNFVAYLNFNFKVCIGQNDGPPWDYISRLQRWEGVTELKKIFGGGT